MVFILIAGVLNGDSYQTSEAVSFFDIMGQNQCFGTDKTLYDIALDCLSQGAYIISTSTCPAKCSNFYVVLNDNCPSLMDNLYLDNGSGSGSVLATFASICQGGNTSGDSPPNSNDVATVPASCQDHYNQQLPAACGTAVQVKD